MLSLFQQGLEIVFTLQVLGLIFFGTVVGIIFGAIPGLTATMAVALFLPITYSLSTASGLALLIGLYIGRSGVSSGFGAAGSLVVVLVWVYWSAQIFLLGAEFTWVWAHARGSRRPAGLIGGVLQRAAGFSDRKALHGLPQ